jgi:hypothetical protein
MKLLFASGRDFSWEKIAKCDFSKQSFGKDYSQKKIKKSARARLDNQ